MGVPVIIGEGSHAVYNPPNVGILGNLKQLILTTFPNRGIIINGYGENLGPSGKTFWTPTNTNGANNSVSSWINAGNVWIDYCGWPMYRYLTDTGVMQTVAGAGFQNFAKAIGYPTLANATFNAALGSNVFGRFPFPRGLRLEGSVDGIYINTNTIQERSFPDPFLRTWDLTAGGYTACFALQPDPPKGGIYFYATFVPPGLAEYVKFDPNYVPEATYAAFIQMVAKRLVNGSTGIQYKAITGIHSQFNPPPATKTVPTYNSSGDLGCGSGFHWENQKCVKDTPSKFSSTAPKATTPTKSSGSGSSSKSPLPTPTSPTLPWYDQPTVRTSLVIGGFALGGLGLAVGTAKLLESRERRDQ